jgi:hypothetical protein
MYQVLEDEVLKSPRGSLLNYKHGLTLNHLRTERWGLIWPLTWPKDWFEATLHRVHPALWLDPAGKFWMADRHMRETDLGSIPPPVRSRISPLEFSVEFYSHDSAYKNHYMWTSMSLDGPWVKEPVTRSDSDQRLDDMIYARQYALGKNLVDDTRRGAIWAAVRAFGWHPW